MPSRTSAAQPPSVERVHKIIFEGLYFLKLYADQVDLCCALPDGVYNDFTLFRAYLCLVFTRAACK